jgi:myo-inositol 2-dehydrogenase / D-chiro-inositol 1-dehydrogenase
MEGNQQAVTRRSFLAAAAAATTFTIVKPQQVRGSQANSAVRLALLGCGGRGTGVAISFVENTRVRLTAIADLYQDNLERAKARFDQLSDKKNHSRIDASQMFHGAKAYEAVSNSKEVDAVYIATPVYFHPDHFDAAVSAGRHVYLEKPVAVDIPGVKRVLKTAEKAKGKRSVTVGLQLRHATPYVELVKRVHGGALGDMVTGLVHYYAGAIERPAWPNASPQERRLRNWSHDRVLSGDIIVEQNVHVIDVTNWALKSRPLRVTGVAGRKGRQDNGDCSSHYNCTYVYPGDVHISFASTQFIKGSWDVAMQYFGTRANAEMNYGAPVRITGENAWEFPIGKQGPVSDAAAVTGAFSGALDDADAMKERAFIDSIVSGNLLYEVEYGAESTVSAIMGRIAAARGNVVTWEETMRSTEVWDAKLKLS